MDIESDYATANIKNLMHQNIIMLTSVFIQSITVKNNVNVVAQLLSIGVAGLSLRGNV